MIFGTKTISAKKLAILMKDGFLLAHPMLEVCQDVFVESKNKTQKFIGITEDHHHSHY